MPYNVVMFTQKALLEEYLKDSRVELLLTQEDPKELRFPEKSVGKVIRLAEETPLTDADGVYKYQSADTLIKEVMRRCNAELGAETDLKALVSAVRVIGVYSPVGRSCKTTLALALAMSAARNNKTLYFNLEEFCGMPELVNDTGGNLSDLLYYFRHNPDKLHMRFAEIVKNVAGFDYIPVCSTPEDYEEIMPEEWISFLHHVIETQGYETIVLDMGNVVHETWKLIRLCTTVYMPDAQDCIGKNKQLRFAEYLTMLGKEELLEKIVHVDIPQDLERKNNDSIEQLEWSVVGDFARRLIYG
jgi:Mrp family chromosome partitioning ATPase